MLKKLFGGIRFSWPKLVVFAVLAAVYTALMALLVPETCSFHDIAVKMEAWILFAIVIICGCDKPLEAACKTFVFFLISQPLVYLIQVPFNSLGWGLFQYYRYWFLITLLTFPGAYLGWYIKKDNILSALILSVMLVLLVILGKGYAQAAMANFPNHLLSAVFCFALAAVLIFGVLHDKKARLTAGAIALAALLFFMVPLLTGGPQEKVAGNVLLDEAVYQLDENWTVTVADESISTGEINQNVTGKWQLFMHYYKAGENTVTLTDGNGKQYQLLITMDEETHISVEEKK